MAPPSQHWQPPTLPQVDGDVMRRMWETLYLVTWHRNYVYLLTERMGLNAVSR